MAWIRTCGRVLGHVADCGDMWQVWWQGVVACSSGWGYLVGQAYGNDGDMWQGCGMW